MVAISKLFFFTLLTYSVSSPQINISFLIKPIVSITFLEINVPLKAATIPLRITSLFTSLTGTIIYWVNGYYSLDLFLPAAVGAIIGAQIGALLSKIISGMWILRILAIMLFIMGIALIIENI